MFDLNTPEIFQRTVKEDGTSKMSRTPSYPAEWQNQFGVTVEEHQKNIQVNIFKGYAVFSLEKQETNNSRTTNEADDNASMKSEESNYEQLSLQPDTGATALTIN